MKCAEVRNLAKTERQKNNGNFLLFLANQSQFFRPPYSIHLNYDSNHSYDHFFPTIHTPMKCFQNLQFLKPVVLEEVFDKIEILGIIKTIFAILLHTMLILV